METILQKPNYGDYRLWRPNYGDLIERPHNIYDICIGTLSGDPLQRYIYKSFFFTNKFFLAFHQILPQCTISACYHFQIYSYFSSTCNRNYIYLTRSNKIETGACRILLLQC